MNTKQQITDLAEAAEAIHDRAELENRDLSRSERKKVEENLARCKALRARLATEDEIREMGIKVGLNHPEADGQPPSALQGIGEPGDLFTRSEGYKKISDPAARASRWSSGPIEVPYTRQKATLLEGTLASPGTGGALVQPDVQAGVAPILAQQLTIADLIPSVAVMSNKVRTLVESVATNAAKIVPEGTDKPESALEFDEVDEPVKKVATFLPVSDELLSDAPAISTYLNGRLSLFVRQQEEAQILGGAGGANLLGLMPRIPVANRFVVSDADTPNAADHIYAAISVAEQSYLGSDAIVVNPVDWSELRLLKDDNLAYIGGSPFSNGAVQPGESLWGRRVVVTQAITAGRALVGAFATGAQLFRRGGLTVEATNSHDDWFQKDLVAIRAEVRLALGVLRPSSFAIADLGGAS